MPTPLQAAASVPLRRTLREIEHEEATLPRLQTFLNPVEIAGRVHPGREIPDATTDPLGDRCRRE
jgi:hypothetical protein